MFQVQRRMLRVILVTTILIVPLILSSPGNSEPALTVQVRRPVSLIVAGDHLLVGNRRSGTVTVVDTASGSVLAEHPVASQIADMKPLPAQRGLLVLDDAGERLWNVELEGPHPHGPDPRVHPIATIPADATKLAFSARRRQVFITSQWRHQLLVLTLDARLQAVTRSRSVSLPFAPRELLLIDDEQKLLVADAFGGRIAVVDAVEPNLLTVRELDGHNIRGLALSADGEQLHVAHQQIVARAKADYEELHWGRMVTNALQTLKVSNLLQDHSRPLAEGWLDSQDGIGGATGDPAAVVTGPQDLVAIAFSGVNEVAVHHRGYVKRMGVGAGPRALAIRHNRLYVANYFEDSLSVIDLDQVEVTATIRLGPEPQLTARQRGEQLFFNARLSHDGWISCHSCHSEGHTSGLLVDTLGDGDYGAPKRVPSLLGTGDTGPWGWDGSVLSLADQVRKSVTTTMHGEQLSDRQTSDLVIYLESLAAPPSLYPAEPRTLVRRGQKLFESQGCADCHAAPAFTTPSVYDVGLEDERQRSSFNPPSLRGVSQRERFFHDGRAGSLEEVLLEAGHPLDHPLSDDDANTLLRFLRTL